MVNPRYHNPMEDQSMSDVPCKYCGVLPIYGHFDWCKIDRAPTAEEIARAVIDEYEECLGSEGPSHGLASLCRAYLDAENSNPARGADRQGASE